MWVLLIMWVATADINQNTYERHSFSSELACKQALDKLWRDTDPKKSFIATCKRE